MLLNVLPDSDAIASGLFGLILILTLGVVGVLIIVLLMIAWRRSVLRGRAASGEAVAGSAVADPWASSAQRLPPDRPNAPPGTAADDDALPDEPDYGAELPYREHFDSNEDEPDEPFDEMDDSDDSQDDLIDDSGFPEDGENDDEDDTDGPEDDENPPPRLG